MTIQIYDGQNVMRRAFERKAYMPGERPMSMRMRFEQTCAAAPGSQIWVWDGRDHNERRKDIYPQYKGNREPGSEDVFSQIRLWREVLKHSHAIQIEVHGWEADDVIGTLVRRIGGKVPVEVFTNDMDYGQIGHLCQLKGVNMKGVPCNRIALYKAMVGDTSDNIDGIPGFAGGRWLEMEPHWDQIQAAIVAGDPAGFADLPFKPKVKAWLTEQKNIDLLQQMFTITHMMNVPDDELNGGITVGVPNFTAADARLAEFFL
jgi:5'-3' exonuclease